MKKSFTLIELLIVLAIVSLIIGLVAPKGAKLLDSINNKIEKKLKADKVNQAKYEAFLSEKENKKLGLNKYGIKTK